MPRTDTLGSLGLFAFALVVRLAYCHYAGGIGHGQPDGFREYAVVAERLLAQGVLSSPLLGQPESSPQPSDLLPPAYVGIVALTYKLLGTQSHAATITLHLLNAVATALAAVVAGLVSRRLAGHVAGWLAGIMAALHPLAFAYTTYVWDTSLFTLGIVLSVWGSLRLSDGPPSMRRYLWFGGGLGLLALLNPAWTTAYPLLVLWPLARRQPPTPGSTRLRLAAMALLGWAIVVVPWTARNYLNADHLSYVRGGLGFELWLGVCPEVDGEGDVYLSQYPLLNADQQERVIALGERAYIRDAGTRAWEAIRANPGRFIRLSLWRAVDFWAGTVLTHTDGTGGHQLPDRRTWLTLLLSAETATLSLLLMGGVSRDLRWLVGALLLFSLLYTLTHVELRFRAPITPVMSITLACAAVAASQRCRRTVMASVAVQR